MRKNRTNAEWLASLGAGGEQQAEAIAELRRLLLKAARHTFDRCLGEEPLPGGGDRAALVEDCAQEALLAVLARLPQFRGESKFTTWAYKFAVNTALTTARRERWKGVSLDALLDGEEHSASLLEMDGDPARDPELAALQGEVLSAVRRAIRHSLTPRQREALVLMVFHEVPMDVVVERLGTNRNAVYKLLHDARLKIKAELARCGIGAAAAASSFETER